MTHPTWQSTSLPPKETPSRVELVDIPAGPKLDDYAASMHLTSVVAELREAASALGPKLKGRSVLMVNSTARGGGVAEMLPRMVGILNELGVRTSWAVIGTNETAFFDLTKRVHNLIHGVGHPELSEADRDLYEDVSSGLAGQLRSYLKPQDLLVIHDPQPAGVGAKVKAELGVKAVWRCHIGLDKVLPQTKAAWKFLRPHLEAYDHGIFTAPEYIPDFFSERATIIHPGLDPYTAKNRELSLPRLCGILYAAKLARLEGPNLTDPFIRPAERLQADGRFKPATEPEDFGILSRPVVMQVSRWDNLKGWVQLLDGFLRIKRNLDRYAAIGDPTHRKTLELMRLVLAGPEPAAVKDDPEATGVLARLVATYRKLDPTIQRDVVVLSLPMASHAENALMVSALQKCSTVVVQNSIQEGFGLTATEPMWKGTPTLVSSACGLRQQIRPGEHGLMISRPGDPDDVADTLNRLLADPAKREEMARNAQRRVRDDFLVFTQLRRYLRVLSDLASRN
jgi:trehalose synthase